jgi:hypothetical protein
VNIKKIKTSLFQIFFPLLGDDNVLEGWFTNVSLIRMQNHPFLAVQNYTTSTKLEYTDGHLQIQLKMETNKITP